MLNIIYLALRKREQKLKIQINPGWNEFLVEQGILSEFFGISDVCDDIKPKLLMSAIIAQFYNRVKSNLLRLFRWLAVLFIAYRVKEL